MHGARRRRGGGGDGRVRAGRLLSPQVRRRSHRRRSGGPTGIRGADRMASPLKLRGAGLHAGADRSAHGALVCIGFMGAGKSTAARSAAEALGTEAVDVDSVIEERLGKPIHDVFARDGEGAFRAAEERITLELLADPGVGVLALGGGAVGHASVREALADHLVVWLDIALDDAWERCGGSSRPLARDREQFARLYVQREPLYA